jgi:hypothetical protein
MENIGQIDIADLRNMIAARLDNLDLIELAEVYGMVRARAAYRDETSVPRRCDNCDALYRGPAVFCCRRCAIAAA